MKRKTLPKAKALRLLTLAGAFLALCLVTGVVTTYGSMQGPSIPAPKPGYLMNASLRSLTPPELSRDQTSPKATAIDYSAEDDLSENDAARYGHIFAFQDIGDLEMANAEIAKLSDNRLMGHVLYQRYLHLEYKASYEELSSWLRHYADQPGADKIYDMAVKRRPASASLPARPRSSFGTAGRLDLDAGQTVIPYTPSSRKSAAEKARARDIERAVRVDLNRERPSSAVKRLDTAEAKQVFDTAARDALLGEVAASYFYLGKQDKAFETALPALERSGAEAPMAGWIAGLMAWKAGDYTTAAKCFEAVANSKRVSAWMDSAGAFWAARAHLRNNNTKEVSKWLKEAARHPRSFYGLLAIKTLGVHRGFYNWDTPRFSKKYEAALQKVPAGRRALALLEARQYPLAELELSRINAGDNQVLREALVALADARSLPSLAMQIGSAVTDEKGGFYDAVLYPVAPWQPENGFEVDRALVFALIRQESRFDPSVSNGGSGAVGLMQLMPATASHILGVKKDYFSGKQGKAKLTDPVFNIELGQKYLTTLMGLDYIDGNLFKLAAAYNAGPGKLQRWVKQLDYKDDPLMFIESIPVAETRMFVEKVMSNYWIYRMRLDQDTSSLEQVAAGQWPTYHGQDGKGGFRFASLAGIGWQ